MPNQKDNAGNEGDVMKHPALLALIDHHSTDKNEFWYVETHAGYPYYCLPPNGRWQSGVGQITGASTDQMPAILSKWRSLSYHDRQGLADHFPDKTVYLGSTAQVFRVLREKQLRIRMTLFETEPAAAEQLLGYFKQQGAEVLLVAAGDDRQASHFIRDCWETAVARANGSDMVMIVRGRSYEVAPPLWLKGGGGRKPDLVLVDPFGFESREPVRMLSSLAENQVPFMCWTPLFCVPGRSWPPAVWSFMSRDSKAGTRNAQEFVEVCVENGWHLAWFSWAMSCGGRQNLYGCQLAFGNVFDAHFDASRIWNFDRPGLPRLEIFRGFPQTGPQATVGNPATTWQTPGKPLMKESAPIEVKGLPGQQWWGKYHVAFWWADGP